jgi:hypothetical protein
MTAESLAAVVCLASGIFGRPAWDESSCLERAVLVQEVAGRHGLDPLLLVAIDVHECELRDFDGAPIYKKVRGRRTLVGFDACPMGVRVMGASERRSLDASSLHEMASRRLARWKRWCGRGHPGKLYRGDELPAGHHYVAHYNQGNPNYSPQVLAIRDALAGRAVRPEHAPLLTPRTQEIIRRHQRLIEERRRS